MWIVLPRQPPPLAGVWAGRKACDCGCDGLVRGRDRHGVAVDFRCGLVGRPRIAAALLVAIRGMWIAVRHNERYPISRLEAWASCGHR